MKLFYSPTSPYVRKVLVLAHELGLGDRIDAETVDFAQPSEAFKATNPLAKVPALVTDDGQCLVDSPVICEYLLAQSDGHGLLPAAGPERIEILNQAALAQGIMDSAVGQSMEKRARPKEFQFDGYLAKHKGKVESALDALEQMAAEGKLAQLSLATISVGSALGYLDLRFADDAWREGRPALAAWYAGFEQRPSMTATKPG